MHGFWRGGGLLFLKMDCTFGGIVLRILFHLTHPVEFRRDEWNLRLFFESSCVHTAVLLFSRQTVVDSRHMCTPDNANSCRTFPCVEAKNNFGDGLDYRTSPCCRRQTNNFGDELEGSPRDELYSGSKCLILELVQPNRVPSASGGAPPAVAPHQPVRPAAIGSAATSRLLAAGAVGMHPTLWIPVLRLFASFPHTHFQPIGNGTERWAASRLRSLVDANQQSVSLFLILPSVQTKFKEPPVTTLSPDPFVSYSTTVVGSTVLSPT